MLGVSWLTFLSGGIAVYGAALSTVTSLRSFFNDRFKLVVRCGETVLHRSDGVFSAVGIQVVNVSRRPVSIVAVGYENLDEGSFGAPLWGTPSGETTPVLPANLKEQEVLTAWIFDYGEQFRKDGGLFPPYPGVWVQDGRGKKHYVDMSWRTRMQRCKAVKRIAKISRRRMLGKSI